MSVLIGQGHILISAQLAGNFGSQLRGHFLTGTRGIAESAGRSLGSSLTAGITAGVGIGAFNMLTSSVKTLGTSLIGTASNMEQAKISFTNMLGSGQKADAFLKQLADFAAKTPFEFPDLVQASQRLMAMGFQAKDVIPTMTAVGDAVAAMGGSSEQINRVTLALGQMQAKTRVQGDELLQLQEAGIPALRILADSYGLTTVEMQKNISAGKVMSSDAIPRLIAGMENGTKSVKGFAGMMEQQSHTMAGLWSTMKDTVRLDLVPAFEPLIKIAEAILPPAIAKVGSVLQAFGQTSKNFFEGLTRGWQDVGNGTQVAVSKLSGVEKIGAAFHTGVFGVQAFFAAMKNGDVTSDGFVGAMERVGASLHNAGPAFGQLGQAIATLVRERLTQFGDTFKQLLPVLGQFASFIGSNIVPLLSAFTRAIAQASGPILAALGNTLKDSIIPAMQIVAGTIMKDVLPAFAQFLGNIGSAVAGVLPVLGNLLRNHIAPALAEVGRWIRDVVGPALSALAKFITTEVVPALSKVLGPVIDGVRTALRMLRDAINDNKAHFVSFYNAIKPIIDFVRDVVAPVLGVVLKVAMLATVTSITLMIRWWGLLAGAIATVINWVKSLRVVWDAAWQALTAVLSPVWNAIKTAVGAGMAVVGAAINAGMTAVRTVWNAAWSVMSTIVSAVWTIIRPIVQAGMTVVQAAISAGMTVIRTVWNAAWSVMSTIVSAVWAVIRPIVQGGIAVISTVISAGMIVVRTVWNAAWTVISTTFGAVWTAIRAVVSAGVTAVRAVIEGTWNAVKAVWTVIWDAIKIYFQALWVLLRLIVEVPIRIIYTTITTVWNATKGFWIALWNSISAFFTNLWNIMKLMVLGAVNWIRDTINTVWNFVKNNIFAPIWNAISAAFNAVWNLLKLIVGTATKWISDTITTVWNFVKNNIFAPIWNAISAAFNTTWNLLKLIVGTATAWIRDTINTVWTFVRDRVFSPIWNSIKSTFNTIWEGIKTIANNAINWVHDRINTVLGTIKTIWQRAWQWMKDTMNTIWDGIKKVFAAPVKVVLTIIGGFDKIVNKIGGWIGLHPNLPENPTVAGLEGYQRGGRLPGYGGGDTVPAMLEPGEAVVPKHLVPEMAAWAKAKRIPGFQTGGVVGTMESYAQSLLGAPYDPNEWLLPQGTTGVGLGPAYTCDGLVYLIYKQAGINIPQHLADQANAGIVVPPGQQQAGDLAFVHWNVPGNQAAWNHVMMMTGASTFVNADSDVMKVVNGTIEAMLAAQGGEIMYRRLLPGSVSTVPGVTAPAPGLTRGDLNKTVETPDAGTGILGNLFKGVGSVAGWIASRAGDVFGGIGGILSDAAKWIYSEGLHIFRIGAAEALKGLLVGPKKAAQAIGDQFGNPGKLVGGSVAHLMDAAVDWVRGREGPDPSAGSASGVADSNAVVAFAKTLLGKGYGPPYYGPDMFSCDGLIWYVFNHFGIAMPRGATNQMNAAQRLASVTDAQPGDVVGFHQNGPSAGNPLGLEFHHIGLVTGANQMIDALGTAYGVRVDSISGVDSGPGHYVRYGRILQNLNPGWKPGGYAVGGKFTQQQMEQAMLVAGASANVAHIFSAIGMAENPASTRVTNPTGTYDSVWALQEAWTIPMGVDINRLNTDLNYAATIAYGLYQKSGFTPWEAFTNASYAKFMAAGGLVRSYDTGGFLPTGLSLAYNGTGRPEPVGGGTQHNTVNLTINVANGDPVTIRTVAQQVVDDALTALARKLSSGAGRN